MPSDPSGVIDLAKTILDIIASFTGGGSTPSPDPPKPAFETKCFGPDHLYYVKYRNSGSGKVEVHLSDYSTRFQKVTGHYATTLEPNSECQYQITDRELWAIWTPPVEGGKGIGGIHDTSKVHTLHLTQASGYTSGATPDWTPWVKAELGRDANNSVIVDFGRLSILAFDKVFENEDLKYIDPNYVPNPKVIAVLRDGTWYYFVPEPQVWAQFRTTERANGVWRVCEGRLYFIKLRNTSTGMVEVHDGPVQDGKSFELPTCFSLAEANNGLWRIGTFGNLYFIKTSNTASGSVEVQLALRHMDYKVVSPVIVTAYTYDDAKNGDFFLSRGFTDQFEFLQAATAAGFPQRTGVRYHKKPYTPLEKFAFRVQETPHIVP